MNRTEHARRFWDALAGQGADASVTDPADRQGRKNTYISNVRNWYLLHALREEDKTVLDFGCGSGGLSVALAGPDRSVVGIDLSSRLLALIPDHSARRHSLFVQYDGGELPLATASIDAICIYAVLQYLDDVALDHCFCEFGRILKPGGRLNFIEQCRRKTTHESDGYKLLRSPAHYANLLERSGLTLQTSRIVRYGRFPTTYLVRYGLFPSRFSHWLRPLEGYYGLLRGQPLRWNYAETLFVAHHAKN